MSRQVFVVREWQEDGYSEVVGVFTDPDVARKVAEKQRHRNVDAMWLDREDGLVED